MSAGKPRWRQAFDRAERTVGGPLEGLVASPRYVDVTLLVRRVRGTAGTVFGLPMTTLRYVLNVPARGDIRRLGHQIAALTNEVHDLAAGMEDLRQPTAPSPPVRRPARKAGGDA
jgi:hypothetical protein